MKHFITIFSKFVFTFILFIFANIETVYSAEKFDVPKIAFYPLEYSQYLENHPNGENQAELISSLLMVELTKSGKYLILDRSIVSELFREKVRSETSSNDSETFRKLPVSDFTLNGALFSSSNGDFFSLKLVKNSTSEIVGTSQFFFDSSKLEESIFNSKKVFERWLDKGEKKLKEGVGSIAFGHFIDISNNDEQLHMGRLITERLIDRFVNKNNHAVLSRTQTLPLLFEDLLSRLQYADVNRKSVKRNSHYYVYGKYRFNPLNREFPISIYLYLDVFNDPRYFRVIEAKNWNLAFEKISEALDDYLPSIENVSAESVAKSNNLFLSAVKVRGFTHDKRYFTGQRRIDLMIITNFTSPYKQENYEIARELVEKSLVENPNNAYSKLTMATYIYKEGNEVLSARILKKLLIDTDKSVADIARSLLKSQAYRKTNKLNETMFESITDSKTSVYIFKELVKHKYFKKNSQSGYIFNYDYRSDQVSNWTHEQNIEGISNDLSIQIFEYLRNKFHLAYQDIGYISPKSFYPSEARSRNWRQSLNSSPYDRESTVNFFIAKNTSRLNIVNLQSRLPFSHFYDEFEGYSDKRKRSNLAHSIDGFSISTFIDESNIESMYLLAFSLCQKEISKCKLSNFLYSWIVENVTTFFWGAENEVYVFLAADALYRVRDINFSETMASTIIREKYHLKKAKNNIAQLLINEGSLSTSGKRDLVVAYGELLEQECFYYSMRPRDMGNTDTLDKIFELSTRYPKLSTSIKKLLERRFDKCTNMYPHMLVNAKSKSIEIIKAQEAMIRKVTSGEVTPENISQFMSRSLKIIKKLIKSGNLQIANKTVQNFDGYYKNRNDVALDMAHLYHLTGSTKIANGVVKKSGKHDFSLINFSVPEINGMYSFSGFTNKNHLKYINDEDSDIYVEYIATESSRKNLGDNPIKWELVKNGVRYKGKPNHAVKNGGVGFGWGEDFSGNLKWINKETGSQEKKRVNTAVTTKVLTIRLEAMKDEIIPSKLKVIKKMLQEKYVFDNGFKIAIKGFPWRKTVGPLRKSHFSVIPQGKDFETIKSELFKEGYLNISGIPKYDKFQTFRSRIYKNLTHYEADERSVIIGAIANANKIESAGAAELWEYSHDSWKLTTTLLPEDASKNKRFGIDVAVHDKHAFICDTENGVYAYSYVNNWRQKQRLSAKCRSIAVNKKWLVAADYKKLIVYKNISGQWGMQEALELNDSDSNKSIRRKFGDFGYITVLSDDRIVVSNPNGVRGRIDELYIFEYTNSRWTQEGRITVDENMSFYTESVVAYKDYIIIGSPRTSGLNQNSDIQGGVVLVYRKIDDEWHMQTILEPLIRKRNEGFGQSVLVKDGNLIVVSRDNIYSYRFPL